MIGIIGGTGVSGLTTLKVQSQEIIETPYGQTSAPIDIGELNGRQIAYLSRHGRPHQIAPHRINYKANIHAMHQAGVKEIVAINAVGGIHKLAAPGCIVLPDQIIDYTYGREHTFGSGLNGEELLHIDFTHPYDELLRQKLISSQPNTIDALLKGCMGVTQGPRLETAAEIQKLQRDGCDIVGMTAMPEAALAKELGIAYAGIALVVNWAAGLTEDEILLEDIKKVIDEGMYEVVRWLTQLLENQD